MQHQVTIIINDEDFEVGSKAAKLKSVELLVRHIAEEVVDAIEKEEIRANKEKWLKKLDRMFKGHYD